MSSATQLFSTLLHHHHHRLTSFSVSSVANKKVVQEVEQTNILDKYQGLLDTLNKHQEEEEGKIKDPLQRLAVVVLRENIPVQRLTLKTDEIRHFPDTFQILNKRELKKAAVRNGLRIPSEIRIRSFSLKENLQILQNWSDLTTKTDLSDDEAKKVLDNSDLSDKDHLYKIIIGHYLSQGLDHVRLACEVFHRLRLLSLNTGEFTKKEDRRIEKFVAQHGNKWSQLSRILWRAEMSIKCHYEEVLQHKDKTKSGKFSIEEDRDILEYVLRHHPDIIEGEEEDIKWAFWGDIGAKLNRKPLNVYTHWIKVIQPVLTRHRAGVINEDFKPILIDYMVENGLKFAQDVDWKAVTKLPQFRGTTTTYLQQAHHHAADGASEKYNLTCDQVTAEVIQKYLRERGPYSKRKNIIKKEKQFVEFYEELQD